MKNVYKLSEIKSSDFSNCCGILFDTNAWFCYIYPNHGKRSVSHMYSTACKCIISKGIPVYLDIVVYQELVNLALRMSWKHYFPKAEIGFKAYRKTPEYKTSVQKLSEMLHLLVFPAITILNPGYDLEAFEKLIDNPNLNLDFNDRHITEICKKYKLALMTNDFDFYDEEISIISGNPKYFSESR